MEVLYNVYNTPLDTYVWITIFGVWYVWCFTILTLPIKNTKWITFLLFSSSMAAYYGCVISLYWILIAKCVQNTDSHTKFVQKNIFFISFVSISLFFYFWQCNSLIWRKWLMPNSNVLFFLFQLIHSKKFLATFGWKLIIFGSK